MDVMNVKLGEGADFNKVIARITKLVRLKAISFAQQLLARVAEYKSTKDWRTEWVGSLINERQGLTFDFKKIGKNWLDALKSHHTWSFGGRYLHGVKRLPENVRAKLEMFLPDAFLASIKPKEPAQVLVKEGSKTRSYMDGRDLGSRRPKIGERGGLREAVKRPEFFRMGTSTEGSADVS